MESRQVTYEDMGFTNIAKTISAKEDEEIWVELHSYRDCKHMDDVERGVMSAKTQNGENASQLFQQFTDLITPGSCIEGEFGLDNITPYFYRNFEISSLIVFCCLKIKIKNKLTASAM